MGRKIKILMIFITMVGSQVSIAQKQSNVETIKIKTSAQCEMCKERLEKAMAYEKGIVSSSLDVKTSEFTVKYKIKKTSPAKIRTAISKVGYDADDVKFYNRSYEKLPGCCKKGGMDN